MNTSLYLFYLTYLFTNNPLIIDIDVMDEWNYSLAIQSMLFTKSLIEFAYAGQILQVQNPNWLIEFIHSYKFKVEFGWDEHVFIVT